MNFAYDACDSANKRPNVAATYRRARAEIDDGFYFGHADAAFKLTRS